MTGDRFNVYLPATLAQRVREAREAGVPLDLSAEAAKGIAAALNGHQAPAVEQHQDQDQDQDTGRLDAIERTLRQLANAVGIMLLVVAAGVLVVSVRSLATS
jgi:hypothetical protein